MNPIKLVAIAIAGLVLVGCANKPTIVTEKSHIVVQPPEGLWNCPDAPEPPSGTYTQAEVADYVLKLYQSHQVCKEALNDVREYLRQAAEITKQVEK